MTVRPSRTTNKLHFADLDPLRFEDLCLGLLYPLHPWLEIRHYGRSGGDGGVDILALEAAGDGTTRTWFMQCKRYVRASKSTLTKAVDDALSMAASPPAVLLVVLACDVTRAAHEAYERYAIGKGVIRPLLWTASTLEARLYKDRKDLLFTYFGISPSGEDGRLEAVVKKSLATKKKVRRLLLKPKVSREDLRQGPWGIFLQYEAIIRSIEDTAYPDMGKVVHGISSCFKVELCDLYHGGIEFLLRVRGAIADAQGNWALVPSHQRIELPGYSYFNVFFVGRLPYRNIVEIDPGGDEYYDCPHLYCRFADEGTPWESYVYRYTTFGREHHVGSDPIDYDALIKGDIPLRPEMNAVLITATGE